MEKKPDSPNEIALERYAEQYDFSPVAIFTLGRNGDIINSNFAGAKIFGFDRSRLVGREFSNFIAPEYRSDFTATLTKIFDFKSKFEFDTVLQKRIGAALIYAHIKAISSKSGQDCDLIVLDMSDRVALQKALNEKDLLLSESQRLARIGSWSMEVEKNNIRWTDETYRIFGVTPETFVPTKDSIIGLIYSKDQGLMREWIRACLAGEQPSELEFRIVLKNKIFRTVRNMGNLQYSPDGTPLRIVGSVQDITEYKRAIETLREKEQFFRMISESVDDYIAVLDLDGRRLYNNNAYARVFGEPESMKKGSDSFAEVHPDDRDRIKRIFTETVQTGVGQRAEYKFLMKGGSTHYMESSGGVIKNSQGEPLYVVVVAHDITSRKLAEERIQHLAFYDELTNLPNRRLLDDRLSISIAASKRSGRLGALIFLDIDNFKFINDTYGHDVGDLLLLEVSRRIADCLREIDTVARFGGDEFVVVLSELSEDKDESVKQANTVAEKIRHSLSMPYQLKISSVGTSDTIIEHTSTSSIGVIMFPKQDATPVDIMKYADIAMYQAKEAGRNLVRFYSTEQEK